MANKVTKTDAVLTLLLCRANKWVDADELARVGGKYAWRTRVSNARRLHNLTIENRLTRRADGSTRSEYCLLGNQDRGQQ